MKKKLSKREVDKTVRDIKKFLRSKEGQKGLVEVILAAQRRTDELRESQKVTWEMMNTPMTI